MVQRYLRDEVSSVTTYTKVLRGFERISLEAVSYTHLDVYKRQE